MEDTVDEVSFVEASVGPLVATTSVLFALVVLPFKPDFALLPGFRPEAVLLVVHPFALVGGSLGFDERATTISHTVEPLPLVDRAVSLDHAA